jgi:hypothetical protein
MLFNKSLAGETIFPMCFHVTPTLPFDQRLHFNNAFQNDELICSIIVVYTSSLVVQLHIDSGNLFKLYFLPIDGIQSSMIFPHRQCDVNFKCTLIVDNIYNPKIRNSKIRSRIDNFASMTMLHKDLHIHRNMICILRPVYQPYSEWSTMCYLNNANVWSTMCYFNSANARNHIQHDPVRPTIVFQQWIPKRRTHSIVVVYTPLLIVQLNIDSGKLFKLYFLPIDGVQSPMIFPHCRCDVDFKCTLIAYITFIIRKFKNTIDNWQFRVDDAS